jgi:hypothetical protein
MLGFTDEKMQLLLFFPSLVSISLSWSMYLKTVITIKRASTCDSFFELHLDSLTHSLIGFHSSNLPKNYTKNCTDLVFENLLNLRYCPWFKAVFER